MRKVLDILLDVLVHQGRIDGSLMFHITLQHLMYDASMGCDIMVYFVNWQW